MNDALRKRLPRPMGIAVFFLAIISIVVIVSGTQADMLVSTDGPPGSGTVQRFSNTGVLLGDFTSGGPALDGPAAIHFGPDGNLYVLSGSNTVFRYNGTTGVYIDTFIPSDTAGLTDAKDMIFGPDGNLYISSEGIGTPNNPNVIFRLNLSNDSLTEFVPSNGGTGLIEPQKIVFGPDGNLYVTSGDTAEVYRYNGRPGALIGRLFASTNSDPKGITFMPSRVTFIPTLNEWGMIIFMTLAGLGAVYYMRRQKRAES